MVRPIKEATRGPDRALLEHVRAAFPNGWLSRPGLVAVSGGGDSMALLELLAEVAAPGTLTVAYVDHGLRPEAAVEAAWVHASARRHRARFVALAARGARTDEEDLRRRRYRALEECRKQEGCHWIATGHTADDQIETILLRLVRGSGRRGLGGIRTVQGVLVRPLLSVRRRELREFLRRRGLGWLEDPSNEDLRYARNRVRRLVLPAIEKAFGEDCLRLLPAAALRWQAEEDFLTGEAQRYLAFASRARPAGPALDLRALEETPAPLRARVLRLWFEQASGGQVLTLEQTTALERFVARRQGSSRIRLAGVSLVREYELLRVLPECAPAGRGFAIPIDLGQPGVLTDPAGKWQLRVWPHPCGEARSARSAFYEEIDLDPTELPKTLTLRPVRPGDRIRPRCGPGRRRVRDMMVDCKVPAAARDGWPVLADGDRVLWVPGIAVAAEAPLGCPPAAVRLVWTRS